MSSEDDQDDLDERKGELWSMDEVRSGGGSATADSEEAEVREDTSVPPGSDDEANSSYDSDTEDTADGASATTESKIKDSPDTSEPSDLSDTSDTEDTSVKVEEDPALQAHGETVRQMAIDAENKGLAVRDLHNVNVYLFESVYHDMRTKFKELDTEYYAAHGEDLSKNKDFFNAVFRAGLESPQLKEELEIE
ncbi:hypothetical protein [Saliphagus infecundisoli]|uniref:Uncharacterized protein n=1 Tax=Saliphagus infecundisoli TaxID=1849069 RepID=A0ABD5QKN9_9EURY|nr:hypothetical protein [Saliphagus infecundisoli]